MLFSSVHLLPLGVTLSDITLAAAVPGAPSISAITFSGNGCPHESQVDVSDDGQQFRLHSFMARAPGADTVKNCALHFSVDNVPAGWQVSLKHVTVRDWGYFPAGSGLRYLLTSF